MQEFEDYLSSKKIDTNAFKENEAELWESWEKLFAVLHPNSFTQQKLFLINQIRRRFPLKENADEGQKNNPASVTAKPKPKFKIPTRPKKNDD